MNKEFDFIDLYYLNDVYTDESANQPQIAQDTIEISGIDDPENVVSYTYAKFMEILDTQGLEGLVNV